MRRITSVVVALVAISLAAGAYALDIGGAVGGAVKDAAKGAGRSVVASEINKNLEKKNCAFKPKSTELTCDIQDILGTIKTQKTVAEKSGLANDVDLYVEIGRGKDAKNPSLGSERREYIQNNLRQKISWWDWYDSMTEGDNLRIYVKIE